jgi:hypothetical protein
MPEADGKPQSRGNDPEQIARALEMELIQKRAAWKQASARHRQIRIASFVLLFIVILGALFAFLMLSLRINEERGNRHGTPAPAVSGP